jgi:hypothetical protein
MIPAELESRFRVLGIGPASDWDAVKSAFRRLARTCHPDVAGPESSARFAEINEAYMDLKGYLLSGKTPQAPLRRERTPSRKGRPGPFRTKEREQGRSEEPHRRVRQALDEATRRVESLLRQATEQKGASLSSHLERLRSVHPAVILLALDGLADRRGDEKVRKGLVELLSRPGLEREIVDRVVSMIGPDDGDLFIRLGRKAAQIEAGTALPLLRSLRSLRRGGGNEDLLSPWLVHPAEKVLAEVLAQWPLTASLPDDLTLSRLLRRQEESILIPLLRLLHRHGAPAWAFFSLRKLAADHPATAVRVWARSVVSRGDVG